MSARSATLAIDRVSPLAEPSARLAAVLVDVGLRLAYLLVVAVGAALSSPVVVRVGSHAGWIAFVALFVIDLVLLARTGQTLGKRALGLRIVRGDGSRAPLGRLFWLRSVAPAVLGSVPLVGWLFGLIDTLAIFGADRRTLHDRMADTIVVDLRAPASAAIADVAGTFT